MILICLTVCHFEKLFDWLKKYFYPLIRDCHNLFLSFSTHIKTMAATLKEQNVGFQVPKLAQDLIAGTCGGWAQVVVGKNNLIFLFFLLKTFSFRPSF